MRVRLVVAHSGDTVHATESTERKPVLRQDRAHRPYRQERRSGRLQVCRCVNLARPVEDRDRSRGIYFVRYLDPLNDNDANKPGMLSSLAFWKDDAEKAPKEFYYIKLISDAAKTKIVILDAEQVRTSSDTAKRLLTLMQEQLSQ